MKLKKFVTFLCIFTLLGLAASFSAQASSINLVLDVPGVNTIQDTDAERVLRPQVDQNGDPIVDQNGDPVYDVITSGPIANGDIIETILLFDTVNSQTISSLWNAFPFFGPLPVGYQLAAYSQLEIESFTAVGGDFADIVFTPSGFLADSNSFVDIYDGIGFWTPDALTTNTPEQLISIVTGESLVASFGPVEADDFWTARGPLNYDIVAGALPGSSQAGLGTFGLTTLNNPGNLPILANGILSGTNFTMHDIVGNASVYQLEDTDIIGWGFSSNTTASFNTIPEPSTMLLLGVGLLAFAGVTRRKIKK